MRNLLLVSLLFLSGIAVGENMHNWQVVSAKDPLSRQTTCLLTSAVRSTEDGQTTTPVSLVYNGELFVARTDSNIDSSYPDLGIQVGHHERHEIDRLHKATDAVFETSADQLRDEFIRGLSAKLTLGFWPTWPKTRSYTVVFDLRGFTSAYNDFLQCQKTGSIP